MSGNAASRQTNVGAWNAAKDAVRNGPHCQQNRHQAAVRLSRRLTKPLTVTHTQSGGTAVAAGARLLLDEQSRAEADCLRLEDHLWSGPETDANLADATANLSPGFKLMLLSDGSVTRHLQLLTGNAIKADCLDMRALPPDIAGLPEGVGRLQRPLIQRQVLLRERLRPLSMNGDGAGGACGPALVYAASWWSRRDAEAHLAQRERPIGTSLTGSELRRDIASIVCGHSLPLERAFGSAGPFWGREYTLWKGGAPLTVIYEVFSPTLQQLFEANRA